MATPAAPGPAEGKGADAALQARVSATLVQARQHLIRNNAAAALSQLKEIAALPDCPADIRLEAAKMLATAGANAEASLCYLNAGLGYLYDQGDMGKARQAFATAHNLDPHNLDVIFHLGQADVVEGRTQDGLAKFIDVLRKSNLKHTPALFEAGCIYQANGQYDQAILAFKKVLDREKNHIQAIVHMGQLHQIKGMVPEAISYYMQAAQITREEQQLGTTRQIANMVLAIDSNNHRARTLLADLDEAKNEDEEPAAPAPKAAPAGVPPRKVPAQASAPPAAAATMAPEPSVAPSPSAQETASRAATAAEASAEHDEARQRAEDARRQAEAAAQEAEFARAQAETARQGAEEARERAESDLSTIRAEVERLAAQRDLSLAQTSKELEAARLSAEQEISQLHAQIERVKAQRETASAQAVAELGAQEQSALEAMAAKREAVQRELDALRQQVEQSRAQAEAARAEAERNAQQAAAARAEVDSALAAKQSATTAAREAAEAAAQLDAELLALQEKTGEARAQQSQTLAAASSDVQTLQKKAAQLEAQAAAAEKRVQEAEQQAAQVQSNVGKAKAAHEAAMLEIAARRQKAQADLDKMIAEVTAISRQKDAERERAELTVGELDAKAESLHKQIEAAEQRRAQVEAKAAAAAATLASLEERVAQEREKSETAAADLKDIMDQARAAQANAAELSSRLGELQASVEAAESKKRLLEDSFTKIKPLVTAAERRRADAEAAALAAEKTAQAAEKIAQAAEKTAQSAQKDVAAAQKAAQEAQKLQAQRETDGAAAQRKIEALGQQLTAATSAVQAAEHRRREMEEAFAKAKSLTAAADQRRAEAEAAAEQAEALRTKREADAEALATRVAALEKALKDTDARVKAASQDVQALEEVSAELEQKRATVLTLEASKAEAEQTLLALRQHLDESQRQLEENLAALESRSQFKTHAGDLDAQAVVAVIPAESCVESLRSIESLAADGELELEAATELASLIHEGRATLALREARKRANQADKPAAFLLVCGDLCRDLGDIAAAREAYSMLALADHSKAPLAQARTSELFLSFAERSTAAALQRDDAHFAASGDPAKAIEAYADLVARFPEDASFREELGSLHERLGHRRAAALAYTRAMTGYLGSDDVARAVELAPKMLAAYGQDGGAYELASRAFERAGDAAESVKLLDAALRSYHEAKAASDIERVCRRLTEIAPDPVPYRKELATLLHEAGDVSGAAEQLLEAADKLVGWSRIPEAQQLLKTVAAWGEGDPGLQERILAVSARAADAQRSVDDVARGDLLLSKGQFERAAEAYRRGLDENPHQAGAAYQLACLLMDHHAEYDAAETLLMTSANLRPDHAATRYRLALVKAAQGRVVEAVELLVALARFDESNADFIEQFVEHLEKDAEGGEPAAKYRLGIAYRQLGRVDEALVILQSIQRQVEYVVLCHNAIGLCLRRQGLDTAAAKRFSKAIETPGYPETQYHEALYNLGELYEAKDTPESLALSLSSFEELYASDCTFKDVADRIKTVKMRIGAAERPKVKRLPTRSAEQA